MQKITLILGAGVNKEIHRGIDLGYELIKNTADRVTDRTSVEKNFSNVLTKLSIRESVREEFVFHLDKYVNSVDNPSIDSFLYEVSAYPEFEPWRDDFLKIGRLSIVFHVLGYEGKKTQTNIKEEVQNRATWLSKVADFIRNNGLLSKDTFNIITFNYDRILEYFLDKEFGAEAKNFINERITHIYGYVREKMDLGKMDNDDPGIINHIDDIKLIHERAEVDVKKLVADSSKILVMGYGLDAMNNKRLGLHECKIGKNLVFNIYPGNLYDFKERRSAAAQVRELVLDATIHYSRSCRDFIEDNLKE